MARTGGTQILTCRDSKIDVHSYRHVGTGGRNVPNGGLISHGLWHDLPDSHLSCAGAFACGQVYVALSRATGTTGLWLQSVPRQQDVKAHKDVLEFYGMAAHTLT